MVSIEGAISSSGIAFFGCSVADVDATLARLFDLTHDFLFPYVAPDHYLGVKRPSSLETALERLTGQIQANGQRDYEGRR